MKKRSKKIISMVLCLSIVAPLLPLHTAVATSLPPLHTAIATEPESDDGVADQTHQTHQASQSDVSDGDQSGFEPARTYETMESSDDFTYVQINASFIRITSYKGTGPAVVIPDTIDGYTVQEIGSNVFHNNKDITSVLFPSGMEVIGYEAFKDCTNLTDIDFNYGLRTIGMSAFQGCTSLQEIDLPDTLESISGAAFRGCTGFTSITLPDNLSAIYSGAFQGCTNLVSINYPTGLSFAAHEIFAGCINLKTITVPEGVTELPADVFRGAAFLTTINLPSTLVTIGTRAFSGCTGLTGITLPASLTTIGGEAFLGCTGLTGITIPDGVTTIGSSSFRGCSELTGVTLPDTITTLGDNVFMNCTNLGSINYPKGLVRAGNNIFSGCSKLMTMTVPEGVTTLPANIFSGATHLRTINLPGTLINIGNSALQGCTGLIRVTLPDSVTTIGSLAFENNTMLEAVWIGESVKTINANSFNNCPRLTIHGIAGSYAEEYATARGIPFSTQLPGTEVTVVIGGKVTLSGAGLAGVNADVHDVVKNKSVGTYITDSSGVWTCDQAIPGQAYRVRFYHQLYSFGSNNLLVGAAYDGLVLPTVTATQRAASVNPGSEFTYSVISGSYIRITGYTGSDTTVIIPGTIGSYTVQEIGAYAFSNKTNIHNVFLPDSVEVISNNAFSNCTNLVSVGFNNGIKSIGSWAFGGCTGLLELDLPNTLITINNSAFRGCTGLTSVSLPDSVTTIGSGAFESCTSLTGVNYPMGLTSAENSIFAGCVNLKTITVPEGVKALPNNVFNGATHLTAVNLPGTLLTIGNSAFYGCTGLTGITLPDNLKAIGSSAFSGCTGLLGIDFPDSLITIENSAFYGCTGLESVSLPDSVTMLGSQAFAYCTELSDFGYPKGLTTSGSSVFFGCSKLKTITVPEGVTALPNNAFGLAAHLETINLPGTLLSIGGYAFTGCIGLTGITFPDKLQSIGSYAFRGCTGLESLTLPDTVTTIDSSAFFDCTNLSSINYPTGLTTVGGSIFSGCSKLTAITVPEGVTELPNNAFSHATYLTTINLPSTLLMIGNSAFAACTRLTGVTLPEGLTTIGVDAFISCRALTELILPGTLTSIGNYAFRDCTGLTSMILPDSVTTLGGGAFYGCTNLSSINYPKGLTSTGGSIFTDCSKLTTITVPEGVTALPNNALSHSTYLTTINLPSTLQAIGNSALRGCTSLTGISLPDNLKTIGNDAFRGCTGLTNITLPDTVTTLGSSAFRDCTNLRGINYPRGLTSAAAYIFTGCTSLSTIIVPEGVTVLPNNMFYNADYLKKVILPDTLIYIGDSAFSGGTRLEAVWFGKGVEASHANAFSNCPNLTIHGVAGSFAEQFAVLRGIPFSAEPVAPDVIVRIGGRVTSSGAGLPGVSVHVFSVAANRPVGTYTTDANGYWSCEEAVAGHTYKVRFYHQLYTFSSDSITVGNVYEGFVAETVTATQRASSVSPGADFDYSVIDGSFIRITKYKGSDTTVALPGLIDGLPVQEIGIHTFLDNKTIRNVYLPDSLEVIGSSVFSGCTNLVTVGFNNGLRVIGNNAFGDCAGLLELNLPNTLTTVDSMAFRRCTGLTHVTLPDSVTTLRAFAFEQCTGLTSYGYPMGLKSASGLAFRGCTNLTAISVPEGVTELPNEVFRYANFLRTVHLPSTLLSIGEHAFSDCTGLITFSIPESVTSIGNWAFSGCTNLRSIAIPPSVTSFGTGVFDNCRNLSIYSDPDSFATIYAINNNIPYIPTSDSIPDSLEFFIDRARSGFDTNFSAVSSSGYIQMVLRYAIKDSHIAGTSYLRLAVNLPEGAELQNSSLTLNGNLLTDFTNVDGLLTIPVSANSGTVRFSVKPTQQGSIVSFARLLFQWNGANRAEVIGVVNQNVPLLTLAADDSVASPFVGVSGIAPALSTVELYVDNVLTSSVTASRAGLYFAQIQLTQPKNHQSFRISARVQGVGESVRDVVYEEGAPVLSSLVMHYNGISYDLLGQGTARPAITFTPGIPFTFIAKFTNAVSAHDVFVVSDRNNIKKYMPMVWNEPEQQFEVTGLFDPLSPNYVPGIISIEYTKTGTPLTWDEIDFLSDEYLNALPAWWRGADYEIVSSSSTATVIDIKLGNPQASKIRISYYQKSIPGQITRQNAESHGYLPISGSGDIFLVSRVSGDEIRSEILDFGKQVLLEIVFDLDNDAAGNLSDIIGRGAGLIRVNDRYIGIEDARNAIYSAGMTSSEREEALRRLDLAFIYSLVHSFLKVAIPALETNLSAALQATPGLRLLYTASGFASTTHMNILMQNVENLSTNRSEGAMFSFIWTIDPSGYVYEAVTSNRLAGVKATAYLKDDPGDTPEIWDASEFNQYNPIYTDKDGVYAWDVPEGLWQVKYELEGYETAYSTSRYGWLPVPPPQMEVNIGMFSLAPPQLESLDIYDTFAQVSFDKYMIPGTITTSNLLLYDGTGKAVPYTLEYRTDEKDLDGNVRARTYILRYRNNYTARDGAIYKVTLGAGLLSYASVSATAGSSLSSEKVPENLACGISLSRTGTYSFGTVVYNAAVPAAISVRIDNTGNQATGALTVSLSGGEETSFTLSATPPDSIAVDGNRSFTVRPKTGLDAGLHRETVTVSGVNESFGEFSAGFEVAFIVSRGAGVTVRTEPVRNTVTPTSITVGEVRAAATNPGGQTVEYSIGRTTTTPANGWRDDKIFENLLPSTTYYVFARTAANKNCDAGAVKRSAAITTLAPEYGITLSKTGTHTFPAKTLGYGVQTALVVTVTNAGSKATDNLTVEITGLDEDSFELTSPTALARGGDLAGIAKGKTREFNIRPKQNLESGTHTATVAVYNEEVPVRRFNVTFTVNRGTAPGAAIGTKSRPVVSTDFPPTHDSITVGTVAPPATNPGRQSIEYAITTSTSGTMPAGLSWRSFKEGEEITFTGLRPSARYHVWARTAANEYRNAGVAQRSAAIDTTAPEYCIALSRADTNAYLTAYTFPAKAFGYGSQSAFAIKVSNIGKKATGGLSVTLGGYDAASFELTAPAALKEGGELTGINAGASRNFSIRPKTGLQGGVYEATVTVSGKDADSEPFAASFIVRFTVSRIAGAGVTVSGRPTVSKTAPPASTTITVNTLRPSGTNTAGQSVEYAITTSTSQTAPSGLKWQSRPEFTGLKASTAYHVWARTAANNNRNAGAAQRTTAVIRTEGITLDKTGRHTFTAAAFTNNTRTTLSVWVSNPGKQKTGLLKVELGGADPGSFTLSTGAIGNIAAGGRVNFTVVPNKGIAVKTHNAKVTVSGTDAAGADFTASFDVRITISRGTGAAVSAAPTRNTSVPRSHDSVTINDTLTVPKNPGGQEIIYAIGTTTATPASSAWGTLPAGGEFTGLQPLTTYYIFARTAQNANCSAGAVSRSAAITTPAPEHGVTLSRTGTHTFSAAAFNYGARTAASVTVKNVGSLKQSTGPLTIKLTGENANAFTLSASTLAGINHNATRSFNVKPVQGLPVRINSETEAIIPYTATVEVSGDNGILARFNVSFRVNKAAGAAVNSVPLRREITANRITVIPVHVSGLNPGGQMVEYAISTSSSTTVSAVSKLVWQSDTTFTHLDPTDLSTELKALTTYYVFTRTAANEKCNAGAVRRSAAIKTDLPDYGITLNRTGTFTFAAAAYGYATRPAVLVTVNNAGKQNTDGLDITLEGDNAASFELSTDTLKGIPVNGNSSFAVRPTLGLGGGTYTATVVVSGTDVATAPFSARFTVKVTINRAAGSAVSGAPMVTDRTYDSITIDPVSVKGSNPGGQDVEYAVGTSTSTPAASAWGSLPAGGKFTGLQPLTTYYVFARTARNGNNNAGAVQRSLPITTREAPP